MRMEKPMLVLVAVLVVACSKPVMGLNDNSTDDLLLADLLWPELGFHNRNCREVQDHGHRISGVYTIYPYDCCPQRPVRVYCDLDTEGGGWTVIQRREDVLPQEDFYRTWMEYALGFGNISGQFWLGLDHIHALTDQTFNQIRFDLTDFDNDKRWAQYQFFYVHDRTAFYKLEVNGYTGNAGDSFTYGNLNKFSTKDVDHDNNAGSCAVTYLGAWWYNKCHESNLNGRYHGGTHSSSADGVNWERFRGYDYSLKTTEMKIRPAY
ncbi:ficolin-2-like [Homarus americanus]|uniref:Ficolin-2-like 1 n=1 Tax=Homarus americanus TaxID=6706 RepID=A0A8J5THC5_HOMAM|nr:ficolin-2-like [Homarus americanus]KAG7172248.1 Ficolin-2-like 1 [Homarus americanus]